MAAQKKTPFDVLRSAYESERIGQRVIEAIDEIDPDDIREYASAIEELADKLESLRGSAERKAEEGLTREEREDAREEAITDLCDLVDHLNSIETPDELHEEFKRPQFEDD